jgi:hypothetical protein
MRKVKFVNHLIIIDQKNLLHPIALDRLVMI